MNRLGYSQPHNLALTCLLASRMVDRHPEARVYAQRLVVAAKRALANPSVHRGYALEWSKLVEKASEILVDLGRTRR
jgi:hypothetical protein